MNDVVVDTNAMRLYPKPKDPLFKDFFHWLHNDGVLTLSMKLRQEYGRCRNDHIVIFLDSLRRVGRLNEITNHMLNDFKQDSHFHYTCNIEDIPHARTVFLSARKKLILAGDAKLGNDINNFPKVNGIKPEARRNPGSDFYS